MFRKLFGRMKKPLVVFIVTAVDDRGRIRVCEVFTDKPSADAAYTNALGKWKREDGSGVAYTTRAVPGT